MYHYKNGDPQSLSYPRRRVEGPRLLVIDAGAEVAVVEAELLDVIVVRFEDFCGTAGLAFQ